MLAALTASVSPGAARANLGDPALRPGLDQTDPPPPGSPRSGPGDPADPPSEDPAAEPEPEPGAPGPIPLFPRLAIAPAAGWLLPPEPTPSDREEEAEAALEAFFDDGLMRDRIDTGDVDGWYHGVGRAMRQQFRPDRGALERERHAGMTLLQQAFDELRRYGRGPEPPQDVRGQTLPEHRAEVGDPTDRSAAVRQEMFDYCNPLNAPVTWYTVVLRVTHNPEGVLSAAWVHRSSGYRTLDRAALEAARSGSIELPAPPARVVGERQAIRSDWSFELGDVATFVSCLASTPLGGDVGCVDDPIHGTMCAVAGRGIIRTRVRLLRVVDATHLTPEERRAARRRDPERPSP